MIDNLPIRLAHRTTIDGLITMIPDEIQGSSARTSPDNLHWMLQRCLSELYTFPIDKLGRWVGFVQGVLAACGALDVDAERDRTRGVFHAAYKASGVVVPKTMQLEDS